MRAALGRRPRSYQVTPDELNLDRGTFKSNESAPNRLDVV
jgi:hypothetical protein